MRTVPSVIGPVTTRRVVIATLLLAASFSGCATTDGPQRGQTLLFAPSVVAVSGNDASLVVQGRISEPAEDSAFRQWLIDAAALGVDADPQNPLYRARMGHFISDSKSKMHVAVDLGGEVIRVGPSDKAGYVTGDVRLTDRQVAELARDGKISFRSVPTSTNSNRFSGVALLVPETGVTVITDMDDTIKITNVNDHKERNANTFVRPFRPVPGMPQLYRAWEKEFGPRIHFHVVSAGPWQFHEPLREFTDQADFPTFTWDMRSVDVPTPKALFQELWIADPQRLETFKVQTIVAFMSRFPKRHVVLVGDSGERDPEAYADILTRFPDRVDAVFIRNVTDQGQTAERYRKLFPTEAMAARLRVFLEPADLPPLSDMADKR